MGVAQPRRRLDRAKLNALPSARRAEKGAELGKVLRWKRAERRQLLGHDPHQRVDALNPPERLADLACFEGRDEAVHVVQDRLEPQFARLVHDDEQQLVGVLRLR
jgi:hypothetical protein